MITADGKIMLVALVVFIIFLGLSAYMLFLDFKLNRMEKKIDQLIEDEVEDKSKAES